MRWYWEAKTGANTGAKTRREEIKGVKGMGKGRERILNLTRQLVGFLKSLPVLSS